MGSQDFHLKWHSHHSNVLSVFEQLMSQEQFVDVTLACEGMNIKAHKMLLSACSPFFKGIFEENPCKHPVIVMKDVKFSELKAIVDFMYRGEIHLPKDELQSFLQTADLLKVKGLTEVRNNFQLSAGNENQESLVNPVLHQITSSDVIGENRASFQPLKKRCRRPKRHSTGEKTVSVSDSAISDTNLQLGKNLRIGLANIIPEASTYPVCNTASCAITSHSASVTDPACEVVTSPAFCAGSMVGVSGNFNNAGFVSTNNNPVILSTVCSTVGVATPIVIAPIYTNSTVTVSGTSTSVAATTATSTSTVVASPIISIPVAASSTQLLSQPEEDWLMSQGQQDLQKHSEENISLSVPSGLPVGPNSEDVSQRVKEEPLSPQASENVAGPSGSVISGEYLPTNEVKMEFESWYALPVIEESDVLYTCEVCHKTFRNIDYKKRHMKIHEERPEYEYKRMLPESSTGSLTCETCNKSFTRRHDLKRHNNTHSNMRVFFSCYLCSKVFSWKRSLQQHVKYHHHKL
ncbi:zinc finger protein 236-like isoform X2 [Limulus polyphemus]|nr:zinc finger protein 236-like isoform X2 [Limulus polyphemus]XP_022251048.1 zinc finger protein 236-like isoform X2 [Limulus polyphemus]